MLILWYDHLTTIPNNILRDTFMNSDPLSSPRLYEQMAERVRQAIIDGDIKTGDRLPNERDLAKQYGVSRTVIREAIKTLRQEGLVEVQPGLGTFVVDATGERLKQTFDLMMSFGRDTMLADIVEIREMLEPHIAAVAAERATSDDIEHMDKAITLMEEHIEVIEKYTEEDHSFHLALARATQNAVLPRLIASIVDLLQELRKRIAQVDGARERGQMHHRAIVDAVRNKDPQAARAAMEAHLAQVRRDSGITREQEEDGTK
jgi:GntR family transcriptional regulator, transcriptional repressor for pyruvate dehydrogenase complex